ncbi:hypothetical protein CLOM_g3037 [Closterium sp. NIES-68]|nr:hypothetical protein CLOM_g3037 [Closterium sp. NIES-68]GJP73519.1 hypothetical protein CLOP_g4222 [Closterium sp. NIES-67]
MPFHAPASDTLWSEKVAQVLPLPATAAHSASALTPHSAKAASAAQRSLRGRPQLSAPDLVGSQLEESQHLQGVSARRAVGANESEDNDRAENESAEQGESAGAGIWHLLPNSSSTSLQLSPALRHLVSGSPRIGYKRAQDCRHQRADKRKQCPHVATTKGKAAAVPARISHQAGQEQHREGYRGLPPSFGREQHWRSHLPLVVPEGSWKEVYRGLVQLDRGWKVPPQLPLQAVGSSSEEEGWGAEWTLRDDFFWFSQPFSRLQEAREALTFRVDLPLCLVTGVEIVSGQDIWNAVCPKNLQVEVGFSPSAFPFSSSPFPLTPAPISQLLRLPPSALALGNHVRLLLSGSPWAEGRGGAWAEGNAGGCVGGPAEGRGRVEEVEGNGLRPCGGSWLAGARRGSEEWERDCREGGEEGGKGDGWLKDGDEDGDGGDDGCMWGGMECEWRALMSEARGRLARRIQRTLSCSSSDSSRSASLTESPCRVCSGSSSSRCCCNHPRSDPALGPIHYRSSSDSISSLDSATAHSPIPSPSPSPLHSPSSPSHSPPSPSLPAYLLLQTASPNPHRPAYILPENAPPPSPRFCIERVRIFGIPLGALPPHHALQAALVRYAVGRDTGELDGVMRSAGGRGMGEMGVEGVVRALGESLVGGFAPHG